MAKQKSRIDPNDLSTWPLLVTAVIGVAIVALLVVLIKSFLVEKVTAEVEGVDKKISEQEKNYEKNIKIVALLPHVRKEVAELEIVRDEAKKYLPTKVSMPSLIDSIYIAARNNGIVFNVTPEGDVKKEFYTIKPISLSAETGYNSMSSFVEEVTTLKRIMNVQSVSFTSINKDYKKDANTPLKMTAQLRTYIFNDPAGSEKKK